MSNNFVVKVQGEENIDAYCSLDTRVFPPICASCRSGHTCMCTHKTRHVHFRTWCWAQPATTNFAVPCLLSKVVFFWRGGRFLISGGRSCREKDGTRMFSATSTIVAPQYSPPLQRVVQAGGWGYGGLGPRLQITRCVVNWGKE